MRKRLARGVPVPRRQPANRLLFRLELKAGRHDDDSRLTGRLLPLHVRRAVAGRAASGPGAGANGAAKSGLQPLQQKLQHHIDREDRRIKELTEAILYDFLPRALRAAAGGDDIPRELTPQKCRVSGGVKFWNTKQAEGGGCALGLQP